MTPVIYILQKLHIVLVMYVQQHCVQSKYHYFYIHWLNSPKKIPVIYSFLGNSPASEI